MPRKQNDRPRRKCTSEAQKKAIRRSYAIRAARLTHAEHQEPIFQYPNKCDLPDDTHVGKVYRGETKYIDPETKKQRNYVVVREQDTRVTVAKLKSIKQFDENGKNADPALVEINYERYGLANRTGVDFQRFDRNRMSGKPLDLADRDVFPEGKERFKLGSHDKYKTLQHTGIVPKPKKKK